MLETGFRLLEGAKKFLSSPKRPEWGIAHKVNFSVDTLGSFRMVNRPGRESGH
jgi:hypothetical protein